MDGYDILRRCKIGRSFRRSPDKIKKLENDGHFKKQVARFEISFSNSMVEALFRSIKNNYLYSQQIKNPKSLRKHVDFWFGEHNDRIPHTAFKGETPFEKFNQTWNKEQEVRILLRQEDAIKLRIKHNQQYFVSYARPLKKINKYR